MWLGLGCSLINCAPEALSVVGLWAQLYEGWARMPSCCPFVPLSVARSLSAVKRVAVRALLARSLSAVKRVAVRAPLALTWSHLQIRRAPRWYSSKLYPTSDDKTSHPMYSLLK